MKLKNLKVARWPFFIFHFLFNCLRYKQNNDRYKVQVQTKYKQPAVLIFIFDKVERQVHIGILERLMTASDGISGALIVFNLSVNYIIFKYLIIIMNVSQIFLMIFHITFLSHA